MKWRRRGGIAKGTSVNRYPPPSPSLMKTSSSSRLVYVRKRCTTTSTPPPPSEPGCTPGSLWVWERAAAASAYRPTYLPPLFFYERRPRRRRRRRRRSGTHPSSSSSPCSSGDIYLSGAIFGKAPTPPSPSFQGIVAAVHTFPPLLLCVGRRSGRRGAPLPGGRRVPENGKRREGSSKRAEMAPSVLS